MSSDSQIIREFVPPPEPLVPPPDPHVPPPELPPVRRGWPKTAWGMILVIVTIIVVSHYLPIREIIVRLLPQKEAEQPHSETPEDAPSIVSPEVRLQGQILVGLYNWTGRSDTVYYANAAALDK